MEIKCPFCNAENPEANIRHGTYYCPNCCKGFTLPASKPEQKPASKLRITNKQAYNHAVSILKETESQLKKERLEVMEQKPAEVSGDWFSEFSRWADDCPENRSVSNFNSLLSTVVIDQLKKAEENNGSLKDQLKELRTKCDCCQKEAYPLKVVEHDLICYQCLFETGGDLLKKAEAREVKLLKGLEVYADRTNWGKEDQVIGGLTNFLACLFNLKHGFEPAKKTIAEVEGMKDEN